MQSSISDCIDLIERYKKRYLPKPSSLWSYDNFRIRSYQLYTADDMISRLVNASEFRDPQDILFDYVMESNEMMSHNENILTKQIFEEQLITSQLIYEFIYH